MTSYTIPYKPFSSGEEAIREARAYATVILRKGESIDGISSGYGGCLSIRIKIHR